jgi:hypothetical protein
VIGAPGRRQVRAQVRLSGGNLNGGGTFPMSLVNVELDGFGRVGPLAASDVSLTVGRGYVPGVQGPGRMTSSGDVSLDSQTHVTFDDLASTTSGDGYPQLLASGSVTLGSAVLQLDSACSTVVGDSFTIVRGASVSGTFDRSDGRTIANNGVIEATAVGARCTDFFKITYRTGMVTATQVPSP